MRAITKKRSNAIRPSHRLLVTVAVSLALASLFFLLQVAPHAHSNGQDDPACGLCQVAHLRIAPAVVATLLNLVLLYFGEIHAAIVLNFTEIFSSQSSSRAPPALFA